MYTHTVYILIDCCTSKLWGCRCCYCDSTATTTFAMVVDVVVIVVVVAVLRDCLLSAAVTTVYGSTTAYQVLLCGGA